jgi:WD40 repeat protein
MTRPAAFSALAIAATAALMLLMLSAGRPGAGGGRDDRFQAKPVQVVDQGFSMEMGFHLSYAFVLENTTADQVLEGGAYRVRFFGADGRLIASRGGPLPLVFPGTLALGEDHVAVARDAASMLVSIEGGEMVPTAGLMGFRPERLTSFSGPAAGPPGIGGGSSATSFVLNPFGFALARVYVGVVFRDTQGRIVGGSSVLLRDVGPNALTPVLGHVELGSSPQLAPTATMFYAAPAGITVAELQQAAAAARALPTPGPPMVTWDAATLPLPPAEADVPFAGRAADPTWQVFALHGQERPHSVLQTKRAVLAEWPGASDRPALRFFSAAGPQTPPEPLTGLMILDTEGREPTFEVMGGSGYEFWPSRDGRIILVQSQGVGKSALYLVDQSGETRILTGISGPPSFVAWSPDSAWLAVTAREQYQLGPGGSVSVLYLVPADDGQAIVVARGLRQEPLFGAWSPDGGAFAYVYDGRVYVFDRRAGLRDLGPADYEPRWSLDGALLVAGASVWDVASGQPLFAPPPGTRVTGAELSPDRSRLVYTEDASYTQPEARRCAGSGLANRTHVVDLAARVDGVSLDCDRGFHYIVTWTGTQWLDGSRLVLPVPSCWGCEGETVRIDLLDVAAGTLMTLAERDRDGRLSFAVSPAGDRFAIGGRSLRVYDAAGSLIAEHPVPQGKVIASIAFSPDGSTIVYVAAPEDFTFFI